MINPRSLDNLIPNSERDPEVLKAMQRKGGIESGKTKRKKRQTKELIKMVLAMEPEISEKSMDALRQMGYDLDIDGAPTVETMMQLMIARNAMNGDLNAAKFLYDYGMIPDMRTQLERERMKSMQQQRNSEGVSGIVTDIIEAVKNIE